MAYLAKYPMPTEGIMFPENVEKFKEIVESLDDLACQWCPFFPDAANDLKNLPEHPIYWGDKDPATFHPCFKAQCPYFMLCNE